MKTGMILSPHLTKKIRTNKNRQTLITKTTLKEENKIYNTVKETSKENLPKNKILVWNAHGIKNFLELSGCEKSRLMSDYFLISVIETWLIKNELLLKIDINNYKYIGSAATIRNIYIHKSLYTPGFNKG